MATGHTITTDCNIDDIDWNDGDYFNIYSGATLTINTSQVDKKIGHITVNDGKLKIENTSDTNGIVIDFKDYVMIDVLSLGKLEINGKLIELYESNGTENQTFKFWNDDKNRTYPYQIPGIFVDGEEPMAMNKYEGNSDIGVNNNIVRYYDYNKDTATFTLSRYYPANGVKIFVPNIIIKRYDETNSNTGAQVGFIRIATSTGATMNGVYFINRFLSTYAKDVTLQNVIIGFDTAYFGGITNLTVKNMCYVSRNNTYGGYPTDCKNVYMENVSYFGGFVFKYIDGLKVSNMYISAPRKSYEGTTYFSYIKNGYIENVKIIYTEIKHIENNKDFYIKNVDITYNDDYHTHRVNLLRLAEKNNNVTIDNISLCDKFYYDNNTLFSIDTGNYRCKIINSNLDVGYAEDNKNICYQLTSIRSSERCGFYNVNFVNSSQTGYGMNFYEGAKRCFITDCDLGSKYIMFYGKDNIAQRCKTHQYGMKVREGEYINVAHLIEKTSDGDKPELRFTFGRLDPNYMEYSDGIFTDMSNARILFTNKDDYVIIKPAKELNLRKLKTITGHNKYGHDVNYIDWYISFDGTNWISENDIDNTNFPDTDDVYIWHKFIANSDDGYKYINQVVLDIEEDDNKPDYEPYFYYTKIQIDNLPSDINASVQVGNNLMKKFSDISNQLTTYELWRESADVIIVKARKYGYSFYESQSIFNDTEVDFYYTGYPKNDLTMTRADALNVNGVVLQESNDADYKWELDCGGNDLESVYHYIQAKLTYHNTDLAGIESFEFKEFLQRDGEKFKTIQARDGEGVKLVNFKGYNVSLFTKDDGSIYEYPLHLVIEAPNLIKGTRVQLYNVTKDVELDNTKIDTDGYKIILIVGQDSIDVGDKLRLRATRQNGTEAKLPIQSYGVVGETGYKFIDIQQDDEKHNQIGVDGSQVDADNNTDNGKVKADYTNNEIDINSSNNIIDARDLIAWFRYIETTEDGIRNRDPTLLEYNPDIYNIILNGDLKINNTKDDILTVKNGVWKRADGQSLISTNSNTIYWVPNDRVYTIETGVSGLTDEESAKLDNLDVPVSSRASQESLDKNIDITTEARDWAKKAGSQRFK